MILNLTMQNDVYPVLLMLSRQLLYDFFSSYCNFLYIPVAILQLHLLPLFCCFLNFCYSVSSTLFVLFLQFFFSPFYFFTCNVPSSFFVLFIPSILCFSLYSACLLFSGHVCLWTHNIILFTYIIL
jgi:hypothetical protein